LDSSFEESLSLLLVSSISLLVIDQIFVLGLNVSVNYITSGMRDNLMASNMRIGLVFFGLFVLTVPIANWMIDNVGTFCVPNGPCLLPVGFGLEAPSGVLIVGLALVLRDLVQRFLGLVAAIVAILIGGAIAFFISPPALVIASVTAFLLSEFADLAVYTPLQKRGLLLAVVASSVVGLIVDSAVFLWMAFGSLDYLWGQSLGKLWMVLLAVPVIKLIQRAIESRHQELVP